MSENEYLEKHQIAAQVSGGSALHAYQDLVVGSRSWLALGAYELFAAWGGLVPGAAGLLLRRVTWPRLLGRCGRRTAWGHGIVLRHPGKMWIGDGVVVDDGCHLDAKGCADGEFRIEEEALVSRGCILSAKFGTLTVGPRANIGASCTLYSSERLEIGADTMLAANCYIGGGRYDPRGRTDVPMAQQALPGRGVVIGEDCWLGAGVVVVDGVSIGPGSVIGAGAVVTSDIPPFSIAVGVPARVTGRRSDAAERAGSNEDERRTVSAHSAT